jgi:hypothetical protein
VVLQGGYEERGGGVVDGFDGEVCVSGEGCEAREDCDVVFFWLRGGRLGCGSRCGRFPGGDGV